MHTPLPKWVNRYRFTASALCPLRPQLPTYRCVALSVASGHEQTSILRRTSIFAVGSEHVVSRQGTPNTLERKFTNRFNRHSVFNRHQNTGTDQNLTGLGFVAEPGCDIGYRPDGCVIEASLEANGAALIGVGDREVGNGLVEFVAVAEIAD